MRTPVKFSFVLFSAVMFNLAAQAQLKMPAPSSTQTIVQEFGMGKITLTYSRPNVKGRAVFGAMEPFGKVWRTGANNATILQFSHDVTIAGHAVPAGEYGLFSIPGKSEWTVILNKNAKQWGAYTYKESDDLLRFTVKPVKMKAKTETFTMQFADVFAGSCTLQLAWENTQINIGLTTDFDTEVMAQIEKAMATDKKPYLQAAQYYYDYNKDINKALEWANAAEAANPKAEYIKYWKARIQLKAGDKAGAIATATAGAEIAKANKNDEYVRLNGNVIKEAK
ncbi:DUF2911 domain-containing protein [Hufsiella ginkgonis]|uniref:DUF2911 domain-containing protein n=1 Tax=Hufsiella ginkgonis TaxID=2695274 RepID=A0A7K1XTT6_9SPHI|nr:DUF2911 domain-containing protein [Hufsiella ginkgonis]MXV14360.1 DUF2911 domain-containing protein [Hufsiella ginkgonis]